ncbi:MAG: hypothetical protein NC177_02905 [Ruminococcus flavefaciens]|nr:hypothetical protein [Ruminococcus flavefaciens]
MIKFTDDFMKKSLARFGEEYKYPVFASMYIKSFFSSYKAQTGFSAVTDDDRLLIIEYSALNMNGKKYTFSANNLKKIKIKKLKLMSVYNIKFIFNIDSKNIKLDMSVSLKVAGGNFPEQDQNAMNFIATLQNWQYYTEG